MPIVVLLHGRGSARKKHQKDRLNTTRRNSQNLLENFLEHGEFTAPSQRVDQRHNESTLSKSSQSSSSSSTAGSAKSSVSSESSSSSSCASPRSTRHKKTSRGMAPHVVSLSKPSASISSDSTSEDESAESSSSDNDEPNICCLSKTRPANLSIRSQHNVHFDRSLGFSTNQAISPRHQHRSIGPRLCMWRIDPEIFQISEEFKRRVSCENTSDDKQTQLATNLGSEKRMSLTKSTSPDHSRKLWPDELVLDSETFHVWLNGKQQKRLKFVLHERQMPADSFRLSDDSSGCSADVGEIHLYLPAACKGDNQVRLVAPFLCRIDLWGQLSSRLVSRKTLANLHEMIGLRVGHWKLQIENS